MGDPQAWLPNSWLTPPCWEKDKSFGVQPIGCFCTSRAHESQGAVASGFTIRVRSPVCWWKGRGHTGTGDISRNLSNTGQWQRLFLLNSALGEEPQGRTVHTYLTCLQTGTHVQVPIHSFTQQMFIKCPLHTGPVLALEKGMDKPHVNLTSRNSESR